MTIRVTCILLFFNLEYWGVQFFSTVLQINYPHPCDHKTPLISVTDVAIPRSAWCCTQILLYCDENKEIRVKQFIGL
jgi:hypothetical protein